MKKDEKIQEVKKEKKLLSPKLDIIFQVLFGEVGSEKITKTFLEAILERRIENIDLSGNIVLRRENLEDKMGVLDVLAKLNDGEYCNIEMQMVEKDRILERMLYYWARIYTKNLKNGYNYDNLKRTIEVLIVNFEIREMKDLEYHTKWKIIEEKYRKSILTEDLEIHIIILPRINKLVQTENEEELMKWLNFIEEPESEKVGKYMKENKVEGNILNVGSSSCLRPATSAYTPSKWGIRGLTLGLAKSLAPYGITVNGIAPGPTATPMLLEDSQSNITNNSNPIGRYV